MDDDEFHDHREVLRGNKLVCTSVAVSSWHHRRRVVIRTTESRWNDHTNTARIEIRHRSRIMIIEINYFYYQYSFLIFYSCCFRVIVPPVFGRTYYHPASMMTMTMAMTMMTQ